MPKLIFAIFYFNIKSVNIITLLFVIAICLDLSFVNHENGTITLPFVIFYSKCFPEMKKKDFPRETF